MNTAKAYGGKRRQNTYDPDAWSTPLALFKELDDEFRFNLDPCASKSNAKCPLFFTQEDDGLTFDWTLEVGGEGGDPLPSTVFMNPPFSGVEKWLEKAHAESLKGNTVVALVKADTSTKWFRRFYPLASEVRFLKRIQFDPPPGYTGKVGSPNMGHAVLVFRGKR